MGAADSRRITEEQAAFIRLHLNDRPRRKYIREAGVAPVTFYRFVRRERGELRHDLSELRQGIRECVLEHYPTMSAKEIHERFGYAKTSVIRLAEKLGVKSSPEKVERLNAERQRRAAEALRKIDRAALVRKWKARRRLDEYRSWEGQPRKTKYRLRTMPKRAYMAIWRLCHRYGYARTDNPYTCESPPAPGGDGMKVITRKDTNSFS